MKLRIRENSLRLRLGPRDMRQLMRDGMLAVTTSFGPSPQDMLIYSLELAVSPSGDAGDGAVLHALLEPRKIRVVLSRGAALRWSSSDQVTLEAHQPIGQGRTLKILVEKDFECVERGQAELDEDAFPNPSKASVC